MTLNFPPANCGNLEFTEDSIETSGYERKRNSSVEQLSSSDYEDDISYLRGSCWNLALNQSYDLLPRTLWINDSIQISIINP